MAQLGAVPKVLKFLKSVQHIQRLYPVSPTLSARTAGKLLANKVEKLDTAKKGKSIGCQQSCNSARAREHRSRKGFIKFIIGHVAQLGAAPKVLKFLKSVQYIQRYHLLKFPVNPTLYALHCWEIAGKQG